MRRSRASTLQASRFYSAFYRWTILTSRPHRQPYLGPAINGRALHLYTRLQDEGTAGPRNGVNKSLIRKFPAFGPLGGGRQPAKEQGDQFKSSSPGLRTWRPDSISEKGVGRHRSGQARTDRILKDTKGPRDDSWLEAEVLTSAQKPFDTLGPWEEVIRYNSSAGVILQLALPLEAVDVMRQLIGTDLQKMRDRFGASAELGQTNIAMGVSGTSVRLQSVLISGGRSGASGLRHAIVALQQEVENQSREPEPADVEHRGLSAKEKKQGTEESRVARPSLWQSSPAFRSSMLKQAAEEVPQIQRASEELKPYDCVLRNRTSQGKLKFELALPKDLWDIFDESFDFVQRWKDQGMLTETKVLTERGVVCLTLEMTMDKIPNMQNVLRNAHKKLVTAMQKSETAHASQPAHEHQASDDKTVSLSKLEKTMKQTLRALSHPVAVVLAANPLPLSSSTLEQRLQVSHGVTISSLTTVTLHPETVVSFNLKRPSRTWDAMLSSPTFNIHLLRATPAAAGLAHMFTQPHANPSDILRQLTLRYGPTSAHELDGQAPSGSNNKEAELVHKHHQRHCEPVLAGPAILARLVAVLDEKKSIQVGDHIIVVAKIKRIVKIDPRAAVPSEEEEEGLAYANRGYRGIGPEIQPVESQSERAATSEVPTMVEAMEKDSTDVLGPGNVVEGRVESERTGIPDESIDPERVVDVTDSQHSLAKSESADGNIDETDSSHTELLEDGVPASEREALAQSDVYPVTQVSEAPLLEDFSDQLHDAGDDTQSRGSESLSSHDGLSSTEIVGDAANLQAIQKPSAAASNIAMEDAQEREQADLAVFESMSRYDEDNDVAESAPPPETAESDQLKSASEQDQSIEAEQDVGITEAEAEMEKLLKEAQRRHDAELADTAQKDARRAPAKETFASEGPSKPEKRGPTAAWGL